MNEKLLNLLSRKYRRDVEVENRYRYGNIAALVGIVSNFILFSLKFIVGTISMSISVRTDAFNNLFDSIASFLALIGFKVAAKPADSDHPFGHARFEFIVDMFVGLINVFVGVGFLITSFNKLVSNTPIIMSELTVVLLIMTLIIKLWQASFNRFVGRKINSSLLFSTAQDSLNDALVNGVILVGLIIQSTLNVQVDGIMGLLLSGYIIVSGAKAIIETINDLLGRGVDKEKFLEMERLLLTYNEILGYHDLMIHHYGPSIGYASVHIEVDSKLDLLSAHSIAEMIEDDFEVEFNINLVVHIDPVILDDPEILEYCSIVKQVVYEYNPDYSFHDFRLVKHKQSNIIMFDLVSTDEKSNEDITQAITALINDHFPNDQVKLVIDRNYLELGRFYEKNK